MKMNKLIYVMALAGGIFLSSCSGTAENKTADSTTEKSESISSVVINPAVSKVLWKGEMLGVYTHSGIVKLTQADIKMKDGNIQGGSFTVDMKSMIPTDDNYKPEEGSTKEKLVGHLSSADFFDVENFPTAKFEISEVNGNTASGKLTVRGITNDEKVENIAINEVDGKVIISGELIFDRKKYDVAWDSPMKDMILSNDIVVNVELTGKQG